MAWQCGKNYQFSQLQELHKYQKGAHSLRTRPWRVWLVSEQDPEGSGS